MSKTLAIISFFAISYWAIAAPLSAQEENQTTSTQVEEIIPEEEVSVQDLGIESTGILPSSPFYFLKEWRRTLTKIFTFDAVKKAELELQYTNERAAEIKKLEEVASSNIEAINKAANNYQQNVERLKTRLEELKQTSENPDVDNLLNNLIDRSLQHRQLFENLQVKFEEQAEIKEKLQVGQEKINEVIAEIPKQLENEASFEERLRNRIENIEDNPLKELQAVKMLNEIQQKLPEQEEKIQDIKEGLIQKVESKLQNIQDVATTTILRQRIQQKIQEVERVNLSPTPSTSPPSYAPSASPPIQKQNSTELLSPTNVQQ
jgi:hypothetical protein